MKENKENRENKKAFMDKDFLLSSKTARRLYEKYADMSVIPVIDYHCHINPREIYEDRQFDNIAQVWLGGDHYKWRQLRTCGVEEKYITGDADDYDKFVKWAEIMPLLIGNPLYHWSHLELRYYFGYDGNLNKETADEVWEFCNKKLRTKEYSARNLIKMSNVKLICTTDDPVDSLEWHKKIAADDTFDVQVLPAWRPDRAMHIEKQDFPEYICMLGEVSHTDIKDMDSLYAALDKRMDYFAENGCTVSDHGLLYVMYCLAGEDEINEIFIKALNGAALSDTECMKYKTSFMLRMAAEYHRRNWVMQLHYGCKRENNTHMFERVGADAGFDCISSYTPADQLADFLNALAKDSFPPKTILYSLNPADNAVIGTVIGCFQGGGIRGRIQHGSAWWFNDHFDGMVSQIKSLAATSALGNFIGMLTDSRSFLSYTRHDYFRRILCRIVGEWVENGEYPADDKLLSNIIKGISYNNCVEYFGFNLDKV